jgi:hypothetical protein
LTTPPIGVVSASIFILVAIAAAATTMRRPAYGVALLLLADPFAFAHRLGLTTISMPKAVLLGLAAGVLLKGVPLHPLAAPAARPLLFGAIAIVLATALSIAQADFIAPAIRETLKACEYLATFAIVLVAFANDPDPLVVRRSIALITGVVSLAALTQVFGDAPQVVAIGNHIVGRIAGPLEGPNQLAAYLGLMIPFLVAELMRADADMPAAERACAIGICSVAVLAEFFTFSRAGVASTLVGVLAVVWALRRSFFFPTFGALASLILVSAAFSRLGGPLRRFFSAQEVNVPSGLGTRSQLWPAAITFWKQHPFLGIGAGNYEFELSRVGYADLHTHANSLPLQALAEGGIPLFAATAWTVCASIFTFFSAIRTPLVAGVLGASVALAVHHLVDLLLFYPKVGDAWWTLLGIGVGSCVCKGFALPMQERTGN